MTNGEFVSRVVNGLRALNVDDHISRRYILGIGKNKSKFYISQKLLDKSLFREDNLFKTIECFALKDQDRISCGIYEFNRCDSLMKSFHKIPNLVYSRYGASIISITSIDGSVQFTPITLQSLALHKDRVNASKFKKHYYYIQDGFLYLPDSEVEMVRVTYIPFDDSETEKVSNCKHVSIESEATSECKSIWESQFMVPDKLGEQVITETINEVFNSRKVVPDENPNGDVQIRSSTME